MSSICKAVYIVSYILILVCTFRYPHCNSVVDSVGTQIRPSQNGFALHADFSLPTCFALQAGLHVDSVMDLRAADPQQ